MQCCGAQRDLRSGSADPDRSRPSGERHRERDLPQGDWNVNAQNGGLWEKTLAASHGT